MRISQNFSLQELVYSPTAIHAGIDQEDHLDNNAVSRITALVLKILQPVRDQFGPTKVNSCFRSPQLNILIGGSQKSQHCCSGTSAAADIEIISEKISNLELAQWISKNLEFDQLILEFYTSGDQNSGWIHCSYSREKNRKQVLTANKENGKTVYHNGLVT